MVSQDAPAKLLPRSEISTRHLVALSSYWFATSFKWFLLLVFLLPDRVALLVPGGEKSAYWGAVFGLGATWAIVGPALFGALSDKAGDRRPYVLAGAVLTCLALFALYSAHGIFWLAAAYLLLQVSDDLSTGPYSAVIPEIVDRDQRGLASGIMSAAMSLSQVAAVLVILLLPTTPAGLYIVIGALNVSAAVLVVRLMRRSSRRAEDASILAGWKNAWESIDFRAVWITRFLVTLAFYLVIPYANFYIRDVVHERRLIGFEFSTSDAATAALALVVAATAALGGIVSGPFIDSIGRLRVSVLSVMVMAVSLAFAAIALPEMGLLAAVASGFGFGYGAFQAANWAMVSDVLPDQTGIGRDMGIWQMSISSVQLLAGAAGLIVMVGNRFEMGAGYRILFGLAALCVGVSSFAVRRVRGTT